jgi:Flp pilus assembly protein TadG
MNHTRHSQSSTQRGTAALEFALILPVFIFLVCAMMEISIALYDKAVLINASREGARAGIVLKNPKLTSAQIQAVVLSYTNNALISLGPNSVPTVVVSQSSPAVFPNPITVTVSYTYSGFGLGSLLSAFNVPMNMSSSTTMINE